MTEIEEIKRDNRVSKLLWFTIGFLCASSGYFLSCKSTIVTNYQITDGKNRNYYTDAYTISNDSIHFNQRRRNKITDTYVFAIREIKILDKNRIPIIIN